MAKSNVATLQAGAVTPVTDASIIESVVLKGDLKDLTPAQRVAYYTKTCESLGLNPFTKPFDYIQLSGKLTLYAKRDACDQLRKINGISIEIVDKRVVDGVATVTVKARTPDGRTDEDLGAVTVGTSKGDQLANGLKKAITQAKRRVTLSICGLGWLDETEVEQVPTATPAPAGYTETPLQSAHVEVVTEPKATPRTELFAAFLNRMGGDEAVATTCIAAVESIGGEITAQARDAWLAKIGGILPPACPICAGTKRIVTQADAEARAYDERYADRKRNVSDHWTPCPVCKDAEQLTLQAATADELVESYGMAQTSADLDQLATEAAKSWSSFKRHEKVDINKAAEAAKVRIQRAGMDARAEETLEAMEP